MGSGNRPERSHAPKLVSASPTAEPADGQKEQIPLSVSHITQFADDDFVELAELFEAIPTNDTTVEAQTIEDPHLWRWQRHGHGKYKGKYYRLVNIQTGRTIKGGYLDPQMIALLNRIYPRKGKGNHVSGANRKHTKNTKPTTSGL